ncbi:MAG: S24 family peptidase [Bryobacteraceae bacterium]
MRVDMSVVERMATADLSLLQFSLNGQTRNIGVFLFDRGSGRLEMRLRRRWDEFDPDEMDVLSALEQDLAGKLSEMGGEAFLAWMEENLSNTLSVTNRETVPVGDLSKTADRLAARHLQGTPFVTHLPLYSLQIAASPERENLAPEQTGWVEAPPGLHLNEKMFVAHIAGRSMEPRIPDGSLAVFRYGITGSRQDKIVAAEILGVTGEHYAIKKYFSQKRHSPDGEWEHEVIVLKSLNPEFGDIVIDPQLDQSVRVFAEFVEVL